MPPLAHLRRADDLVTSPEATRAGFLALAIERSRLATPFVEQARAFRAAAISAGSIERAASDDALRAALLAAASVSDKALTHFEQEEQEAAIKDLVERYAAPAGRNFADELVYRFLLTKGDSLGGMMRNVGGRLAHRRFARAVASALEVAGVPYYWMDEDRHWHMAKPNEPGFEEHARGISWTRQSRNRTLMFNRRVPAVRTNVDLCLLNSGRDQAEAALRSPAAFLALGELKGGIDPAGADEHWKTARTAIARIHTEFAGLEAYPALFFVGAAIARSMATEIWGRIENNTLANAANLTDPDQLAAIAHWLQTL